MNEWRDGQFNNKLRKILRANFSGPGVSVHTQLLCPQVLWLETSLFQFCPSFSRKYNRLVFISLCVCTNLPIPGQCSKEITIGSREDSLLILLFSDSKWCAFVLINSPKRWVLWYTHPFTLSDQSPVSSLPPPPNPVSCVYLKPFVPFVPLGCQNARQSFVSVRTSFLFQAIWPPQKHGTKLENPCVLLTVSSCPCAFFDCSHAVLTIPICLSVYRLVNMIAWDICMELGICSFYLFRMHLACWWLNDSVLLWASV